MISPLSTYSLLLTNPGADQVELSEYFAYSGTQMQTTITQNFGRQSDTATIVLVEEVDGNGNFPFYVQAFAQIILTDQSPGVPEQPAGGVLLSGVVTNPVWKYISPTLVEWELQCVDYAFYAQKAATQGEFAGVSAGEIICQLTANADCGIKAALVQDGGFVQPGPIVPQYVQPFDLLTKAWKKLATVSSDLQSFGWYVDQNMELHWYNQFLAEDSGITVTDTPTEQNIYECHILNDKQEKYEYDGSSIITKSIVVGSKTSKQWTDNQAPTEQFIADGSRSAWPLSFSVSPNAVVVVRITPAAKVTTHTKIVGKVKATKKHAGSSGTVVTRITRGATPKAGNKSAKVITNPNQLVTSDFIFVMASNGVWSLQVNANALNPQIPKAGSLIQIWYDYEAPTVGIAQNQAAVNEFTGPNGGIFAEVINDSQMSTAALANARAQADLVEYSYVQERITFSTSSDWGGWFRAGQLFTLNTVLIPDSQNFMRPGFTGKFLIIQMNVTIETTGYRQIMVTALRIS